MIILQCVDENIACPRISMLAYMASELSEGIPIAEFDFTQACSSFASEFNRSAVLQLIKYEHQNVAIVTALADHFSSAISVWHCADAPHNILFQV